MPVIYLMALARMQSIRTFQEATMMQGVGLGFEGQPPTSFLCLCLRPSLAE